MKYYRTTEELKSFAESLLPSGKAEIDGEFEARRTISLLHGPPHEFRSFESVEDEIRGVAGWIATLLQQGFRPQDLLLLARTKELLQTRAQPVLQACQIDAHYLDSDNSPQADKIIVATMHRAKGLECRAAVVLGCDAGILPKMSVLSECPDESERRAFIEQEQNLLYVACTRARERLLVTCTGEPSTFLL